MWIYRLEIACRWPDRAVSNENVSGLFLCQLDVDLQARNCLQLAGQSCEE